MSLAWGGHANGRIPTSALLAVPWAAGHYLERSACLALIAVNVAYLARFGSNIAITDSYRPYAVQERIFRERYVMGVPQGTKDVRTWQGRLWYLRKGQASAAVPGTSNHGWAKAVDLGGGVNAFGTPQHEWFRQWADDAGWVHPWWAHDGTAVGGTDEPWHFEYPTAFTIARPIYTGGGVPIPPTATLPDPLEPEDDDMFSDTDRATLAQVLASAREATVAAQQATAAANAAAARADAATAAASMAVGAAVSAMQYARTGATRQGQDAVLRALQDVRARLPRTNTARYDRVAAATYDDVAAAGGTYTDLSGELAARSVSLAPGDAEAIAAAVTIPAMAGAVRLDPVR